MNTSKTVSAIAAVNNISTMKDFLKKVFTRLTPILGAGAIGVCPLCWIGSASLLTYENLRLRNYKLSNMLH